MSKADGVALSAKKVYTDFSEAFGLLGSVQTSRKLPFLIAPAVLSAVIR